MKEYKVDLSMYEGKVLEVVSEAIQRHAFELGYEWFEGGKKEMLTNSPYLFFDEECNITHLGTEGKRYFEHHRKTEISAAEFLSLTPEDEKDAPEEPGFKPFDRVLVRDDCDEKWRIDFFEGMNKDKAHPYLCLNS